MYLWATVHAVQAKNIILSLILLIIEDYEKLKAKVADIEEKKQIITG